MFKFRLYQMLRHLIEAKRATRSKVAKDYQIAESTIAEVFSGTRKLTHNQITKLARYFHASPNVFS